ncbi:hypothetical protein AGR13a_Lc120132 [Agrobacterium genomosp. 13 str. CFBP 6927]|uniref:Transposase n=1 Tax=Agrobacterium genomosp. 13 str. CFBP 6927 TaxID=1183428 RepID=A0ABP2BN45_9HYPH|nr:hypothetical protein AGR13a_Lc120132 [Agrobacterium genomosp. 13 str. CFBP 6927]
MVMHKTKSEKSVHIAFIHLFIMNKPAH